MGIVLTILLIIGGFLLMVFLLNCWLISKIISEIASIVSLINSFFMVDLMTKNEEGVASVWIYVICTVLGWMFFMGEFVFDTTYEGLRLDFNSGEISEVFSGGFWGNLGGSIAFAVLSMFFINAAELLALYYVIPIILLIINTISIIKG